MAGCFALASHRLLPQRKTDFATMRIPLAIAFTPFPVSDSPPVLLPYPVQKSPRCQYCRAFAESHYIRLKNTSEWMCPCCMTTNRFVSFPDFDKAIQAQSSVFDVCVQNASDRTKQNVDFRPMKVVFLVEKSELSLKKGLFTSVLNLARNTAKEIESLVTLLIFDKTVHVPVISSDRKRFSITRLIEPDYTALPRESSMLFSLPSELSLFESYLETIESDSSLFPIRFSLMNMLDAIGPLLINDAVPVVFSCQADIGDFSKLSPIYVKKSISVHLHILCCDERFVDTTSLSEFLMETNSKLKTFGENQLPNLEKWKCPLGIRRPLATISFPSWFLSLKDVIGCGLRTAHDQFVLSSMSEHDTLYFLFEYERDLCLTVPNLVLQFRLRYYDHEGCCIFRIITIDIPITGESGMANVCKSIDENIFLSSSFVMAVTHAREVGNENAAFQFIEEIKNTQLGSQNSWTGYVTGIANMKIRHALRQMNKDFAPWDRCARLFGRNPAEVVDYFCPMAYKITLGSDTVIGPYTLSGYQITAGALCFNVDSEQAVVLVSGTDNAADWIGALQTPPLYSTIAQICQSRSVYVLANAPCWSSPLHRFVFSHVYGNDHKL